VAVGRLEKSRRCSWRGHARARVVLERRGVGVRRLSSRVFVGELDPGMTDGQFLLAEKANGKPLFGENGAFRLVVSKDKRGARSIRMLKELNVVQLKK
jgi:hypothetical protein